MPACCAMISPCLPTISPRSCEMAFVAVLSWPFFVCRLASSTARACFARSASLALADSNARAALWMSRVLMSCQKMAIRAAFAASSLKTRELGKSWRCYYIRRSMRSWAESAPELTVDSRSLRKSSPPGSAAGLGASRDALAAPASTEGRTFWDAGEPCASPRAAALLRVLRRLGRSGGMAAVGGRVGFWREECKGRPPRPASRSETRKMARWAGRWMIRSRTAGQMGACIVVDLCPLCWWCHSSDNIYAVRAALSHSDLMATLVGPLYSECAWMETSFAAGERDGASAYAQFWKERMIPEEERWSPTTRDTLPSDPASTRIIPPARTLGVARQSPKQT
jgi:hypothetical protein